MSLRKPPLLFTLLTVFEMPEDNDRRPCRRSIVAWLVAVPTISTVITVVSLMGAFGLMPAAIWCRLRRRGQ